MSQNGDAPIQYVITQGEQRWVVKLSDADLDASKLGAWVKANEIEGEIMVTVEYRMVDVNGIRQEHRIGPIAVDAGGFR
jgi:hypothetical protein